MISTPMILGAGDGMLTRRRISVKRQDPALLHRPIGAVLLDRAAGPARGAWAGARGKAGGGKQDKKTHTLENSAKFGSLASLIAPSH